MRLHLERITVFPIKALDGVAVESSRITPGGSLEFDRLCAIFGSDGKAVNGKKEPKLHRLRTRYSADFREVALSEQGGGRSGQFSLEEPAALAGWLADYLGYPVTVESNPYAGFPDDRKASGPTVVSVASLSAVAGWYPGLEVESVRRRFRTNLELGGKAAPFAEDLLYGPPGEPKPFRLGEVNFVGHNPCRRCPVPTRDPDTGEAWAGFQQHFVERRRNSLPPWAQAARFDTFYRFAVNTAVPPTEVGKRLRVGDELEGLALDG